MSLRKNNKYRIALGTVQFGLPYGISNAGGQVSRAEAAAIIGYARSSGMRTLDTAIAYGNSEERLGEVGVRSWQVVSKLPPVPEGCTDVSKWVKDSVQASLQRLNHAALYGLLLHRPQNLLEAHGERLYKAMLQLKQEGLVEKIGVSIYETSELDALSGLYGLDLVQAPFNLLDRRLIDSGWMARLEQQGTELHVRSIFLQGLLLMGAGERPEKFGRWSALWKKYDAWLKDTGLSPMQACIRFALSFSQVSRVVVGVDCLAQLEEILEASDGPMPAVPEDIRSDDVDLLNPARWNGL